MTKNELKSTDGFENKKIAQKSLDSLEAEKDVKINTKLPTDGDVKHSQSDSEVEYKFEDIDNHVETKSSGNRANGNLDFG